MPFALRLLCFGRSASSAQNRGRLSHHTLVVSFSLIAFWTQSELGGLGVCLDSASSILEDFTEELLSQHDAEIQRMKQHYEDHKELFDGVHQWEENWRHFQELEVSLDILKRLSLSLLWIIVQIWTIPNSNYRFTCIRRFKKNPNIISDHKCVPLLFSFTEKSNWSNTIYKQGRQSPQRRETKVWVAETSPQGETQRL